MSKNSNKRLAKRTGKESASTSSPAVGRGVNDKVAKGSNPRFSPFKGVGRLQQAKNVANPLTKKAASKVAVKSGAQTRSVGRGTKKVNANTRPIPQGNRKNVQAGQKSYPSKRLMAIMDPEERAQF